MIVSQSEAQKLRPNLAIIALIIGLGAPVIQVILGPFLQSIAPFPVDRFLSLWVFWIAIAFVLYVSVRIEGIPLATFGITKNTRSLRYRLIEMIAGLLTGLVGAIVIFGFSNMMRDLLNAPANATINPDRFPPFWVMLPAWITAALGEEILFRSYPIERLSMMLGNRWVAAIISSLAFTVLHIFGWDWVHVLTAVFPASVMLTGLYLWRRSLWFVVIVHGVMNLPLLFLPLIAPYL